MQLRQSLRLDGKKVCNIKRADISQVKSNKATVCALPSIHLPLTRDGHGCPKLNAQRLCMDAKPTKRSYGKGDSAFCRIALLGFAIRVGTPVNMKEGDNQRDQVRV